MSRIYEIPVEEGYAIRMREDRDEETGASVETPIALVVSKIPVCGVVAPLDGVASYYEAVLAGAEYFEAIAAEFRRKAADMYEYEP